MNSRSATHAPPSTPARHDLATWLCVLAGIFGLGIATVWSIQQIWCSDDAYISFRYARNWVEGRGLVFNAGEYVEGYTNFLWTVLMAGGIALDLDEETWSAAWGIGFYLGTILLLLLHHLHLRGEWNLAGATLPFAALAASLHKYWAGFATCGLETTMVTFFAVAGYVVLVQAALTPPRAAAAALLMMTSALSRPAGILFAGLGGLYILWMARKRPLSIAVYAAVSLAIFLPYTLWRISYYGDYLPNTYYAKSAYTTWYEQGWHYVGYYFQKYWALLLGPALVPVLAFRRVGIAHHSPMAASSQHLNNDANRAPTGGGPCPPCDFRPRALLALTCAGVYSFYILRVGGDFMFGRMLIPPTPFFLLLLDYGLLALHARAASHDARPSQRSDSGGRGGSKSRAPRAPTGRQGLHDAPPGSIGGVLLNVVAVALLAGMLLTPSPMVDRDYQATFGIADERAYYNEKFIRNMDGQAALWKEFFHDLPVCMAFFGSQARVVYKADISRAIEGRAGLTDRTIAHLPTPQPRGRVGHEKMAPVPYLVSRGAHFIFSGTERDLPLNDYLPHVRIQLRPKFSGRVLHWDPELMQAVRERGARFFFFHGEERRGFTDFGAELDRLIARLDTLSPEQIADEYRKLRMFYFYFVEDPQREQAYLSRLREVPPLPEYFESEAESTSS